MADLGWLRFRTAFDFDADVHRTDRAQWRKDRTRAPRFEDADWSYVRGGAPDLKPEPTR